MARPRRRYRCSECGHEQNTFAGICPGCKAGGTLEEFTPTAARAGVRVESSDVPAATFTDLADVAAGQHARQSSGITELDRVLGGGIVPGSYIAICGAPGMGKSSICSQLLILLSQAGQKVGYISGEESEAQARMRFERFGAQFGSYPLPISTESSVERICRTIEEDGYDLLVVDSIQTLISEGLPGAAGSVSQINECSDKLRRAAKRTGTSVVLVGQVTKDGAMAGPRMLEHAVDVVLAFEGDRNQFRILRALKNRFGSTDEIAVFEMKETGLEGIEDVSRLLVSDRAQPLAGSAVTAVIEGARPVLCEVQALVETSNFAQPIRAARGLDTKRVQMLLAVLSRKAGLRLGSKNVYLNVSGGLKIDEPGVDLAVCLAIASAVKGRPVREQTCVFGEVSLLGEVAPASQAQRRESEARRLGYAPLEVQGSLEDLIDRALSETRTEPDLDADQTPIAA